MDRKWMHERRDGDEYEKGIESFISFAITHAENPNNILCPCVNCNNMIRLSADDIRTHLIVNGINQAYKCWTKHGENIGDVHADVYGSLNHVTQTEENYDEGTYDEDQLEEMVEVIGRDCSEMLQNLSIDAKTPLYFGCKLSKLAVVLKLYSIKARSGWSDASFTSLLEALKEMFPEENVLPARIYEAKKMLSSMGMGYEKIHACRNDCILYRKEYASSVTCPKCGASRYTKENVPAKVMWYFPIVPRFRRLFGIAEEAEKLTWHADKRKKDGFLRHPADSPQWKKFDKKFYDHFGRENRNLRLVLSTDGMNPHGNQSSTHSTWPVMLMIYNLPPELCMKRKYMMLSMLISGPRQPGNDIDVYLEPLIDDLKMMWESGAEVFDAHRNETFNLKAMLFGTINDFPAYGNLSGYSTKGYQACPICDENTYSIYLDKSRKNVYMGHRKSLPVGHHYRRQKQAFDGRSEEGSAPVPLTGEQVLKKVEGLNCPHGKRFSKDLPSQGFKKKSIFFTLPYWKDLYVRHFLDVMHIEKNVCESLVGTLLHIPTKTKDSKNARLDLVDMNIRPLLAPVAKGKGSYLPPACYTLSKKEKREFCEFLQGVKVPEGYSSNIRSRVSMKDLRLLGMKSHDYHVLMENFLPVAIRSILPERVRYTITKLCLFFSEICKKEIDPTKLNALQTDIVITLCQLEMYFPPSFFDIMVHLIIHLVREVQLCGPAYLRYMYPVERYMKILKGYVHSRSRPEGCIVERALIEEAIEFCSHFLSNIDAIGLPKPMHNGGLKGKGISGNKIFQISRDKWDQAHLYVLHNSPEVDPYITEHMEFLERTFPQKSKKWLADQHNYSFIEWFRTRISHELEQSPLVVSDRLKWLSRGPRMDVLSYTGYQINGHTFYTKQRDSETTVQNSGVSVVAEAMHISSAKDRNPIYANMAYYGVIESIWELDYVQFRVPIFGCKWVENNNGKKVDKLGFTLVDLNRVGYNDEPFILATQAKQVFYVDDPAAKRWSVVLSSNKRNTSDIEEVEDVEDTEEPSFNLPTDALVDSSLIGDELYVREDHFEGIYEDDPPVATTTTQKKKKRKRN